MWPSDAHSLFCVLFCGQAGWQPTRGYDPRHEQKFHAGSQNSNPAAGIASCL
jgi:hypothetical protein